MVVNIEEGRLMKSIVAFKHADIAAFLRKYVDAFSQQEKERFVLLFFAKWFFCVRFLR